MSVLLLIHAFILIAVLFFIQHRRLRELGSKIESLNVELHKLRQDLILFKEASLKQDVPASPSFAIPEQPSAPPIPEQVKKRAVPPPMPAITTSPPPGPPPKSLEPDATKPPKINWERFMGVNLFAWIGGFVLFLGAAFFLKYSIDNNLISPQIRVMIGFVLAAGLVAGGLRLSKQSSPVTAQTLCATGILILYVDIYASHSFYNFFGITIAFLAMIVVTAIAFWLAVRLNARLVAVLGLLGGFLTPPLLSTGKDNPLALFSYIFILNAGLIGLALRKQWKFLVILGAVATVMIQAGWAAKYFSVPKIWNAWLIFAIFQIQFLLALKIARNFQRHSRSFSAAALLMPLTAIAFTFFLLFSPSVVANPIKIFSFVLFADLCLMGAALIRTSLQPGHRIAGLGIFVLITLWIFISAQDPSLRWALGLPIGFAILHSAFPLILRRIDPAAKGEGWAHLFPVLSLFLVLTLIFKSSSIPFSGWFVVIAIDFVAVCIALYTSSVRPLIGALLLTVITMIAWIFRTPVSSMEGLQPFILITMVSVFLTVTSAFAAGRSRRVDIQAINERQNAEELAAVPVLSAVLPFMLLIFVILRLTAINPNHVFAITFILALLLLSLWRWAKLDALTAVALGCSLAVEYFWYAIRFTPPDAAIPTLTWYFVFYVLFTALPFLFLEDIRNRIVPWAVAALSGPLHFYLLYSIIERTYQPGWIGALPAILSVPALLALAYRAADRETAPRARLSQLALFGGSALFFITVIFPVQFEKQWITIGWALEGAALLWLFHKIPHSGLKWAGCALLVASFVRLALNPSVFGYYERSTTPIVNWYLYTYGIVTVCLMSGARMVHKLGGVNMRAVLYTLGTILAFLLMNIEIADYFSEGRTLVFQFSGNFARDMTYSISWASFAFLILIAGIRKKIRAARFAAIALLALTLLKLFLHDLSNLNQLYRVGALVSIAIILILASYVYQRFVSFDSKEE